MLPTPDLWSGRPHIACILAQMVLGGVVVHLTAGWEGQGRALWAVRAKVAKGGPLSHQQATLRRSPRSNELEAAQR